MSGVDPEFTHTDVPGYEGERLTYDIGELIESEIDTDPFAQLRRWLDDAEAAGVSEPTAMTVSSLGQNDRVHSRTVLLRRLTSSGLVFFTNRDSHKGAELALHPTCAAQLLWLDLHRQVRVEGTAVLLDDGDADEYFAGRPRGSQIGAWASPQSEVLRDRADLEARVAAAEERFADADVIPRPSNWGGYRIEPDQFEFWQGRPSRLHDRLRYRLDLHGHWIVDRLAP
ncbi:MAG: pyridoxamine 5'-phosphate oxidase [Acidimicrobiales bacterium]